MTLNCFVHMLTSLPPWEMKTPNVLFADWKHSALIRRLTARFSRACGHVPARTEAIEAILQALEEDPSRSGDWLHYAHLLEAEGEAELALEANERCLTLDRQNGEAWALKARLLSAKQGRDREALKAATHAVALEAGGVDAIFLKSELLELEGSAVAAEETSSKRLKPNPTTVNSEPELPVTT